GYKIILCSDITLHDGGARRVKRSQTRQRRCVRVGEVNKGQFTQAVGVCLGMAVGWAKMDFGDMINVRIQQRWPVHLITIAINVSGGREGVVMPIGIQEDGQRLLTDIVDARGLSS